jgi:glycosyltransferase involved in cell wall biosynthesis
LDCVMKSTGDGTPWQGNFPPPVDFITQSKWAASIAVLDAGIVSALRSKLPGKEAVVLPDFSDEVPASAHYKLAEEIRARAKGRKIIGLLGALARRKGLLTLIRIAKQSASQGWYFVFAGEFLEETFSIEEQEEIKSFFDKQRENCTFHINKIPDDAQFNALVNVCDVIFAMYEDFLHSSNLITKSAIFGKSVLVSTGGYMEEVVRRYKLGEAVPARDIHAALSALHRLTGCDRSPENLDGMKEYAISQSQEKLRQIFLELVENSINRATGKGNIAS